MFIASSNPAGLRPCCFGDAPCEYRATRLDARFDTSRVDFLTFSARKRAKAAPGAARSEY
jgi:hypothetical protein